MRRRTRRHSAELAFAAVCGGLAGMVFMSMLTLWLGGPVALSPAEAPVADLVADPAPPVGDVTDTHGRAAAPLERRAVTAAPPAAITNDVPDPALVVEVLRQRGLEVPVHGVSRGDLRGSFADARGDSRRHEAMDILAPRDTPVVAVEDGSIARLFTSKAGGLTVYQYDPDVMVAYYYAHLERYAEGLREGEEVRRGQVLGYVGTSGNAPPDTPHLHFAIFVLTAARHWWEGTAIDPMLVLRERNAR